MRKWLALFLVLLFSSSFVFAQSSPPDKALLEKVLAAWATLDPSRAAVFYAKDPGLVFYDIAPRSYSGWAAYDKGTSEMFKTMRSASFTLKDAAVHPVGNTAWATALVDTKIVNKDGTSAKVDTRWTTVWEKRGNNWLIVHDHFSAPLPEPPPKSAVKKKKS